MLEIPSNNILVLDSTADDHSFPYVFESMLKDIQDLSSITKVKIPEARYQNFKSKIDIAVIIEPRQEDSNIFEIELTARDGQKKTIKYCINQERNAHISTNKIFLLDVNQIEDLEKLPLGSIAGSIAYFASRLRHALPLLGFLPIQINNGNGYMKVVQHTKEEMKYLLESFNVFENIFNRPNFNFPGLYDTVKKEISALKNIVGSTQGRENIESLSSVSSAVKNKPQLINREEMLGIKLKQDEAEFMSVLSKDKFLNLSKDEKRLLRVVGDILAVIVGGVIFLGHSGKPYIPIPEVRETIFNMAKELNIDIVVTDRLLLGIINKINTTLSGNPSFKDKYQKLFAYAIARYYYQHYFIPVSGGKAPAVAEPFDLSQSGDLINRGPAALWGAGLAGIHWITVANGKHNIYLIDNNSFVVTILDQFKRLAEKQNVEIVNEDVTDDNFADKISQKFDLIMVTKMLHEAGRTVTGAIETVTNKEKEIPLHGKDAQLARSKLYQNLSLSLTKTGAAMIFEVSPGDQWNSKTITNEIEKEGKLQVTGSNDHSINGRIVSQVNVEVKVSSSPVVGRDLQQFGSDADKKGGIAFNALPIQTESIVSSALGALSGARIFKGDLDEEWTKIQSVYNAGIRPSIQRLSEYTVAAIASPLAEDKIDQVRVMLADILRRDEESQKLTPAEESCKQLLRTLESG